MYVHLQELRTRLLWITLSVTAGTMIGYLIRDQLLAFLIRPLNQPLFYTSPAGGLDFVIKVCFCFGLLLSLPITMYQLFLFIAPALPTLTRQLIIGSFLSSFLLLIVGVSLAYFISLPAALLFLNRFGEDNIKSLISTDEYLSFILRYLLGFGFLFQLPLVMLVINSFQPLSVSHLMSYQRWVILISFILAAIITPTPDPFNMTFMALPIIVLYEASVAAIFFVNR